MVKEFINIEGLNISYRKHNHRRVKTDYSVSAKGPLEVLGLGYASTDFIVFDIECTGGNPQVDRMTEIAALRFSQGKVREKFYTLVNPEQSIPPLVRKMTGINDAMVKKAPKTPEVIKAFQAFLGDGVLVSHNVLGDLRFLRFAFKQYLNQEMLNYFLCTHLLGQKLYPNAAQKSLTGFAAFHKFPQPDGAHRAEADAQLTLALLKTILKDLDSQGIKILEEAIRYQADSESMTRLGSGIDAKVIDSLPHSSGLISFCDQRSTVHAYFGAKDAKKDLRKLFLTQNKSLKRLVMSSKSMQFKPMAYEFDCIHLEIKLAIKNQAQNLMAFHDEHPAYFVGLDHRAEGYQLNFRGLRPGFIPLFGPFRSQQDPMALCEELIPAEGYLSLPEAHELFKATHLAEPPSFSASKKLLSFIEAHKLRRFNGLMRPSLDSPKLYWIRSGRVSLGLTFPLSKVDWLRFVLRSFAAPRFGPLTAQQTAEARLFFWWYLHRLKKEQGSFHPIETLAKALPYRDSDRSQGE